MFKYYMGWGFVNNNAPEMSDSLVVISLILLPLFAYFMINSFR